jgi:hypothetical protein
MTAGQEFTERDLRDAWPGWAIVLTNDDQWLAWLTTGPEGEPAPRLTGTTFAELAAAMNEYVAGSGCDPVSKP